MGLLPLQNDSVSRYPSLLPYLAILILFSITFTFLLKVDNFASRTKTLAGHNLDPTPWHLFEPKTFEEEPRYALTSKIIQCSYFTCPRQLHPDPYPQYRLPKNCPEFFRWIHRDLEPWTRISVTNIAEAKKFAAFRVLIVKGRLFVDYYYACVQSRAMFTIWGLLQMIRRFPGIVPDVDLMFDCMDKPTVNRTAETHPLPLFRYCTSPRHFDIPFPDWSFWGWPEVNIMPWDEEFMDIKKASNDLTWDQRQPYAYWKGNPNVQSPVREELQQCNSTSVWGAEIMRQDWGKVAEPEESKLSNQCKHRYKIYAEGYAWSVSLKYILSCGSPTLIISPQYKDFFSRGLIPIKNYWPVSSANMCPSIKRAVDWGNSNPNKAKDIGREGQLFMENLDMDHIYDYMYHLILEYSKLLDFKPNPPSTAIEVCADSLLCFADPKQKEILERSRSFPSEGPPCGLQHADKELINRWIEQRRETIFEVSNLNRQKS